MPNLLDSLVTENNTFPDNQWANVMRNSMENKNLLSKQGALYAGTGGTVEVITGDKDAEGQYIKQVIAKTSALLPPSDKDANKKFLIFDVSAGTETGYIWRKIADILTWEDIKDIIQIPEVDTNPLRIRGKILVEVSDTDKDWVDVSNDATAFGKYCKTISLEDYTTISPNVTGAQNIYVQLMMWNPDHLRWTIVNGTVEIGTDAIYVYSNVKFDGKILIFDIGT